jgi:hypothetical protein
MRHRSSSVDSYATRLAIKTAYDASVAMEARASALGMFNISIGWRGSVYCLYCDNKIVTAAREAQRRKKPPIKVPQMHVSTFCGTVRSGLKAGAPSQALFHTPDAMILLASGSVLLCDSGNHTVSLISPDGHCTHLIASSCLLQPAGLTVIHNEVIVADSGHHRLRRCSLATHAPSDVVERSHKDGGVAERSHHHSHHSHPGSSSSSSAAQPAGHGCRPLVGTGRRGWEDGSIAGVGGSQLHNPAGLAILTDSPQQVELVVADRGNHCLRLVTLSPVRGEHRNGNGNGNGVGNGNGNGNMSRQTSPPEWRGKVETIAGKPGIAGHADGVGLSALFASPTAVVVWDADTLLVADSGNCCVRRLCRSLPRRGRPRGRGSECEGHEPSLSSWTVSTLCGHPSRRGFRDGPLAKAMFQSIVSLAIMPDRSLAICDYENHRIRWLAPNFKTVATLAGNGEGTWKNGPGSRASFCHPRAICLGMHNSLLVADGGNHCVRLLQPQDMPNHPSPHRPALPLQTLLSQAHATAGAIAMTSPQGTPLQPSRMEVEEAEEEAEAEEGLGAGHSPRALLPPPPPATAFLQQFVPHAPMSGRALEARQTPRVRQGRYHPSEAETSTLRQAHIVDGRYSAIFQQTDIVNDESDNSHEASDDAIDNQEEQVEEKEVDDELVVAAELEGVVEVGDEVGTETEHETEHVHVRVLEGDGNDQPVRSPLPQATPSLSELASPVAQAIARTQALNDSLLQEEENRHRHRHRHQHRPPANERREPSPLSLQPPSYLQPADSTTVYPLPPHSNSRPSHDHCDMAASDGDPALTQVLQRMFLLMDNHRDSEEEEEDRGVAAYRSESTGQGRLHSPYGTYTVSIALATATAQQNVASFYEENAWLMARGSMPEAAAACLSSALSLSAAVKAVCLRQQMQMEQALCAFDPDFFAQTQTSTRSALDTLIQRVCSPQMGWSEVALVDNSHQLVVAHQGQLHCAAGMTYTCSIALLTPATSPMVPADTHAPTHASAASASAADTDTAIVYLGDMPCPSVKCRRLSSAEGGPYRVEILAKVIIPNAYCPSVHANELTSQHIPQLTVEWRQSSLQATTQVALPLCVYPSQAACDRQMARMEEAVVQRAVALPKELQLLGMHTTRALNTLQFTTVPDSVQDSTLE